MSGLNPHNVPSFYVLNSDEYKAKILHECKVNPKCADPFLCGLPDAGGKVWYCEYCVTITKPPSAVGGVGGTR